MMPTYKGNIGNLLQHWILCELIQRCSKYWTRVRFVDAHSMAPLATERLKSRSSPHLFDHARDRAKTDSTYEQAWRSIVGGREGYPNSASFVSALWPGTYSMLLCEYDKATVQELRAWAVEQESRPHCLGVVVPPPGDWRQTFERGGWESEDLTLLSFDPDMFNHHGSENARNMRPSDLTLVAKTVEPVAGSLVVQLSTYDVNDDNGQKDVKRTVESGLKGAGIKLVAAVTTDRKMMSLVMVRGCDAAFTSEVAALAMLFDGWLMRLKTSEFIASQPNQRLHPTAATPRLPPLLPLPRGRRG